MSEETVYESRRTRSRRAIASYFHRIGDAFDAGEAVAVDEDGEATIDPPEEPSMEVEVEEEDGARSLELEVEWDPDEDAEADADSSQATFELYEDNAGQYRWRLRHTNGNIIADSGEGYASKANAENGIQSVKKNAPGALVEEQD